MIPLSEKMYLAENKEIPDRNIDPHLELKEIFTRHVHLIIIEFNQVTSLDGRVMQTIDIGSSIHSVAETPEKYSSMVDDGFSSK